MSVCPQSSKTCMINFGQLVASSGSDSKQILLAVLGASECYQNITQKLGLEPASSLLCSMWQLTCFSAPLVPRPWDVVLSLHRGWLWRLLECWVPRKCSVLVIIIILTWHGWCFEEVALRLLMNINHVAFSGSWLFLSLSFLGSGSMYAFDIHRGYNKTNTSRNWVSRSEVQVYGKTINKWNFFKVK